MCVAAHNRGSRSFKVIDVGTPGKVVSSACYDQQRVYVYLQPRATVRMLDSSTVAEIARLEGGTQI